MKSYRIDAFKDRGSKILYFDTENEAVTYGKQLVENGSVVFLLKLIDCINKYDVIREITLD